MMRNPFRKWWHHRINSIPGVVEVGRCDAGSSSSADDVEELWKNTVELKNRETNVGGDAVNLAPCDSSQLHCIMFHYIIVTIRLCQLGKDSFGWTVMKRTAAIKHTFRECDQSKLPPSETVSQLQKIRALLINTTVTGQKKQSQGGVAETSDTDVFIIRHLLTTALGQCAKHDKWCVWLI